MQEQLTLIRPSLALADDFLALTADFRAAEPEPFRALVEVYRDDFSAESLPAYIEQLERQEAGIGLLPAYVPSSTFWLVRDQRTIVAISRLRHRLTPALERHGGHIGYTVRPTERRKGYATRLLALTLEQAWGRGLDAVLLTCDRANAASAAVIRANGGQLSDEFDDELTGTVTSRYWIRKPEVRIQDSGFRN
jgi:predicted acetyltransferase